MFLDNLSEEEECNFLVKEIDNISYPKTLKNDYNQGNQ